MLKEADFCPDCGQAGVSHRVEYATVGLRLLVSPFQPLTQLIRSPAGFSGIQTFIYTRICALAERLGLGAYHTAPDEHTLLLTKALWEAAPSRGVTMKEFRFKDLPRNSMTATLPNKRAIDFDSIPIPRGTKPVWWLDNKAMLKKHLAAACIPVPKGRSVSRQKELAHLFNALEKPLIVKPIIGSASRHTTLHIKALAELERAFKLAKQIAPLVVVEEEIAGAVYRPTVLDGKVVATLRRDTPQVVGDGEHTIEELVIDSNKDPKRGGPYFGPISLVQAKSELSAQGHTMQTVLPDGVRARLHPKINWSVGGTTADVTDEVHPENIKLFEKIAGLLGAPLVGIDFIIEDISKPWQEQRSGVIECNTMPYFDNHHLPFTGKPRDVAGPYWDMYLKRKGV
jgi:D-alanine-D-alanine ligase-like ATP-grasp enzyme